MRIEARNEERRRHNHSLSPIIRGRGTGANVRGANAPGGTSASRCQDDIDLSTVLALQESQEQLTTDQHKLESEGGGGGAESGPALPFYQCTRSGERPMLSI